MRGPARRERQHHRFVVPVRVVERVDRHLARNGTPVDDPHEPLPLRRVVRLGKQRHPPCPAVAEVRRRGQVRDVARGTVQQVQDLDVSRRADEQPPLAGAVAQRAVEPVPGLQLARRHRARGAGGHREADLAEPRDARVVDAGDGDLRGVASDVDDAQPARLVLVAARIEERHPAAGIPRRHRVVHRGQEAVRRAHVRQHLDVEAAVQFQPPVALAGARRPRQPLAGVARLEVAGIEVHGLAGAHGQRRRAETPSGVVDRVDVHRPRPQLVVDDPHEALPDRVRGGREERHPVRGGGVLHVVRRGRGSGGGVDAPRPRSPVQVLRAQIAVRRRQVEGERLGRGRRGRVHRVLARGGQAGVRFAPLSFVGLPTGRFPGSVPGTRTRVLGRPDLAGPQQRQHGRKGPWKPRRPRAHRQSRYGCWVEPIIGRPPGETRATRWRMALRISQGRPRVLPGGLRSTVRIHPGIQRVVDLFHGRQHIARPARPRRTPCPKRPGTGRSGRRASPPAPGGGAAPCGSGWGR